MNIDNLEIGKKYKSYKELCEVLGEKPKRGDSKTAQLKVIDSLIEYDREGNGFIITKIKDEPDEIYDGRSEGNNSIPYAPSLEEVFLDTLLRNGVDYKTIMSKTSLFRELGMTNANYGAGKMNMTELSKRYDIDIRTTEDIYNSADSMMEGNMLKMFKTLEKGSWILWSKITMIDIDTITEKNFVEADDVRYDAEGNKLPPTYICEPVYKREHREATDAESVTIINAERKVLDFMNYEHKGKVIAAGKWNEFIEKVSKIVREESNIHYYYPSYKFLFNPETIAKKREEIKNMRLNEIERMENLATINEGIQERVLDNAQGRQDKAKKCFGESQSHRATDRYIPDTIKLNNVIIDPKASNIAHLLREDAK